MPHIHVIHENAAWLEPLAAALDRQGLPWRDWFLDRGVVDLSRPPPEGVFYNRMSASSHTRDHRYAAELTASVLAWLEAHGRRVVNGGRALDLEISKARQYAALDGAGIRTPATVLVESPDFEPPVDGLHLLQQYIRAPVPLITRAEFIGGRFMYAVEVDTSNGFELCPADQCAVGDAFCPVGPEGVDAPRARFTIIDDIDVALKRRYEAFLAGNDIGVAGIEFITATDGSVYTYDVNTNTNYNPDAEARASRFGMETLARYLGAELSSLRA